MDEKEPKSRKNLFRKLGFWGIAFIALLVAVIGVGTTYGVHQYAADNPEFCTTCHNMESHVESYMTGNTLDNIHYQAGVGCKDCHTDYSLVDELTSVVNYVSGNYEEVFSQRKFEDEMCTECHISMEYLAANTDYLVRNPHQSHWPDLRCGSCHISHDNQVDYCSRCHDNGGQRLTGDPIIPRVENPWADSTQAEE